jgi:transcription initiation factor TFIIF subunit beta
MPENELLDRIFACFRKFNYWSMKAFRAELQQPEVYLRETLDKVAVLARSGPFAAHWSLKPENKVDSYNEIGDDLAPENDIPSSPEDEDDDEDVKFEDV